MAWPVLNWREWELRLTDLAKEAVGLHVDRIVVPERPRYPDGYLKHEWVLRLTGRKQERALLFSVRPRKPALDLLPDRGPAPARSATQSAFGLALAKHLRGSRLTAAFALPRERTVVLTFTSSDGPLGLFLSLIPTAPEAVLASLPEDFSRNRLPASVPVLARSRAETAATFTLPDGARAPESPEVRADLVRADGTYGRTLTAVLDEEAHTARVEAARKALRDRHKQASERALQSETAANDAAREPDWQRYGNLLKSVLHDPPPVEKGSGKEPVRRILDHVTEETAEVPADPRLSPTEQVERFYRLARRKQRRVSESRERLAGFVAARDRAQDLLARAPSPGDWPGLERWESAAGLTPAAPTTGGAPARSAKKGPAWLGRQFTSKDGWVIYVGKSKDENLELTFRIARGNDLWLHIRGRPGAHVVIPVQPGKSVPLETLLDAAHLCLFYSGGERWGTTEVDYTQKKHVKRIRDSTEASYTQNKTLLIQPDPERMKRLMGAQVS